MEGAVPTVVSAEQFHRVAGLLQSRAPAKVHPRRVSSPYVLSGLVRCERCDKALTGQESKSGRFAYYVCQSLLKRGSGVCDAPRLNAKRFERLIVDQIRDNVLTERNIRDLVKLLDEEMDGLAHEHRQRLEAVERELADVRRWLERLYRAIETTDLDVSDIAPRIREHRERQERLEAAAGEARALLSERRVVLDDLETITAYAKDMRGFLRKSELTETRSFINSFVKDIVVSPGKATVHYTVPIPQGSRVPALDAEDVALRSPVLSTVKNGSAYGIRTRDLRLERAVSLATRRTRHWLPSPKYRPRTALVQARGRRGPHGCGPAPRSP